MNERTATQTLADEDLLHVEAARHADEAANASIEHRRRCGLKPHDRYAKPDHWLVRYEAYKAGVKVERERRIGDVNARVMRAGGRREGRTLAMVRSLPMDVRFIVVHTTQMKDYIERMLREERPGLFQEKDAAPRVIVVTSTRDCDRLRGCRFVVDHACLEHASPEVHALLRALDKPRSA